MWVTQTNNLYRQKVTKCSHKTKVQVLADKLNSVVAVHVFFIKHEEDKIPGLYPASLGKGEGLWFAGDLMPWDELEWNPILCWGVSDAWGSQMEPG